LNLSSNRLVRLPARIGDLSSLKLLTITGNFLPLREKMRVRRALPHTMVVE